MRSSWSMVRALGNIVIQIIIMRLNKQREDTVHGLPGEAIGGN